MAATDYASVRANLAARETADWPLVRLIALVDDHEAGLSFLTIAKRLGGGLTKNACIAKAHRLSLPLRDRNTCYRNHADACRAQRLASQPERAARRPAPLPPKKPTPIRDPAKLAALALPGLHDGLISDLSRHQCRWPVGDPKARDFTFCGRLRPEGQTYCGAHTCVAVDAVATARANRRNLERVASATPRRTPWRAVAC